MDIKEFSFTFENENEEKRADLFISEKINVTRSFLKNNIIDLIINDKKSKLSKKLKKGDKIFLKINFLEKSETIIPQKGNLNIVYEDNYFIIIRKEAGIPVHPSAGHYKDTLCNYINYYFEENGIYLKDAGLVHRLDKDTEGLIIFAKSNEVAYKLRELFKKREIKKYYFAILCNNLKKNSFEKNKIYILEDFISRDPKNRLKFTIKKGNGKRAILKFKPIFFFDEFFLVNIRLITGRTHQIRVQFSDRGFPIVGDIIYGNKNKTDNNDKINDLKLQDYKMLLYSYKLEFIHPVTLKKIRVMKRIPQRMKVFIKTYSLKKSS